MRTALLRIGLCLLCFTHKFGPWLSKDDDDVLYVEGRQ